MARLHKIVQHLSRKSDRKIFDEFLTRESPSLSAKTDEGETLNDGITVKKILENDQQEEKHSVKSHDNNDILNYTNRSNSRSDRLNTSNLPRSKTPPNGADSNGGRCSEATIYSTPNTSCDGELSSSSPMKIFRCSQCPFSCNQIVRLNRHENKHYVKADHQCTFCSFSCRSAEILDQHLRLHTTPTKSSEKFDPHLEPSSSSSNSNLSSKCEDECSNSSNILMKLEEKQKVIEKDLKPQVTSFVNILNAQLTLTETTPPVKKKRNLLSCLKCPYKSMHGCDMKAHRKMHEPPARLHACSICSYSAMRLNALRTHELLHTGVQPEHIRLATEACNGVASSSTSLASVNTTAGSTSNGINTQKKDFKKEASSTSSDDFSQTAENANIPRISGENPVGTLWEDEDLSEVTLRAVYDRSNRFIGEKRCLRVDYNVDKKDKIDDKDHYYRCAVCYHKTSLYAQLFIHLRCHYKSKHEKVHYSCDKCNFRTDVLVLMRNHKSTHSSSLPELTLRTDTTEHRDEVAVSSMNASVEMGANKRNDESELEKNFKCTECPFAGTSYAKLWHHIQKHKKLSRFACTKCTFSSGSIHCLQNHLRLHASQMEDEDNTDSRLTPDDDIENSTTAHFSAKNCGQVIQKIHVSEASTGNSSMKKGEETEEKEAKPEKNCNTGLTYDAAMDFCEFTLPEELTRNSEHNRNQTRLINLLCKQKEVDLLENEEPEEMETLNEFDDNLDKEMEKEEKFEIIEGEEVAPQLDEYPLASYYDEEQLENVEGKLLQPVISPLAEELPLEAKDHNKQMVEQTKSTITNLKSEINSEKFMVSNESIVKESIIITSNAVPITIQKETTTLPLKKASKGVLKKAPTKELKFSTRKKCISVVAARKIGNIVINEKTEKLTTRSIAVTQTAPLLTTTLSASMSAPSSSLLAPSATTSQKPLKSIVLDGVDFNTVAEMAVKNKSVFNLLDTSCEKENDYFEDAKLLSEALSRKKARLQCKECPFECSDSTLHALHAEMHTNGRRPFKCNVCTFNCFCAESLHAHLSLHASPLSPTSAQQMRRRRYAGLPTMTTISAAASTLSGTLPTCSSVSTLTDTGDLLMHGKVSNLAKGTRSASGSMLSVNSMATIETIPSDAKSVIQCTQCSYKTIHNDKFLLHRMEHVQLLQQRLSTTIKRAQAQAAAAESDLRGKTNACDVTNPFGRLKVRKAARRINRMHTCTKCAFKCDSVSAFSRHLEYHGAPGATFLCKICDYGAQTHNIVLFHERNHHLDGSLTVLFKNIDARKRVEEHNSCAEKELIAAKKRKFSPSDSTLEANKNREFASKGSDNAEVCEDSTTPKLDTQFLDADALPNRVQLKAGMFRCARCDFFFYELRDLDRHWEQRHVNVANATERDRQIGEMLKMNLVPRGAMSIVV